MKTIRMTKLRNWLKRRAVITQLTGEAGLTILEVMISIIILTIALLGLLGMGMVAMDGNEWANDSTRSMQLMQQKLEELRATPFPKSGTGTYDDVSLSWTVSNESSYLRRVSVTATWYDNRHEQSSNTLYTLIKVDSL